MRETRGPVAEPLGVARSLEHFQHQVVRLVVAERTVVRMQAVGALALDLWAVGRGATSRLLAPPGLVVLGHVARNGLRARSGVAFQ